MPEIPENQSHGLFSQVADAMRQAKLMVWAGDYRHAEELLEETASHRREELERAERLGRSLLRSKRDRQLKRELLSSLGDEARGKSLAFLLNDKLATLAAARTNYRDDEFALAILALAFSNCRKRILASGESQVIQRRAAKKITSELPTLAEPDDQSGFRYLELPKDDGRFEIRAYRPIRQDLAVSVFVERLQDFWRNARLVIEAHPHLGAGHWPIWFRAFSQDFLVEGFVPEPNVVWLELTFAEMPQARELSRQLLSLLRAERLAE